MVAVLVCVILLVLMLGSLVLWAMCLYLGLRWVRVEGVTTHGVLWTTATVFALQILAHALSLLIPPQSPIVDRTTLLVGGLTSIVIPLAVIMFAFRVTFFRAFLAYLWTLLSAVCSFLFVLLVLNPFVVQAFTSPVNGMAPTLLGRHARGMCPTCDSACYCTPPNPQPLPGNTPLMICDRFHITEHPKVDPQAFGPDRFPVAKFIRPRRWDLVVFRFPEDPNVLYIQRLVGLPGEEIKIEDGAIWANGQRLEAPAEIQGLEYQPATPENGAPQWGSPEQPARLDSDEYFMLGDFTARSYDSRMWRSNSSGRHPYGVPQSHLVGVVTNIYWPPSRWRIFR